MRQRFTGETLSVNNATVVSQEIRSDRQITDMPLVGIDAAGDIMQEAIFGPEFDTLMEAALCGTWAAPAAITDGVTTNSSPTVTSATAAFSAADLHHGISGTGIPANSFIGIINSPTSIGLSSSATANTPANATADGTTIALTVVGRAATLRNGVTNRSFGIEAGFLDIGKYMYFAGCIPSKLALDITARAIIKLQTTFSGKNGIPAATSVAGSTTPTEPGGNAPMRAGSGISILSAGTSHTEMVGVVAKRITIDFTNALRARDLATSEFAAEPGRNVMEIMGTIETYFQDITLLQAFLANGLFAVRVNAADLGIIGLPNTYQFTFPTMKVSAAPVPIPGNTADVMQTFNWRALLDPAVGYSVDVKRGLVTLAS